MEPRYLRFVKNMVRYIEDFVNQEVPLYMTKVSLFSQLKETFSRRFKVRPQNCLGQSFAL